MPTGLYERPLYSTSVSLITNYIINFYSMNFHKGKLLPLLF